MIVRPESVHGKSKKHLEKMDAKNYLSKLNEQRAKGVLYPLQPKQLVFANTAIKFRLFGGAKGGGKSYAMRAESVRQALSCPGVRGLVLRRTFPEVNENTLIPMLSELKLAGVEHKYNGTERKITFPNGSTIKFSYCRNEQDVIRYQGIEYDFICVEELTHWREKEFKILKSCLRTSRPGIIPNFFASTNPGGVGHAWVRRIWINRKFEKGEKHHDYAFVGANVYDNFVLMDSQPEYMEDLEDLPDAQREAFLHGNWDVFEGQYFPEFARDIHVTEPFYPIIGIKRRIMAMDYGYAAPSCVLWMCITNQNKIIVYRELYQNELTYEQLAIRIGAMTPVSETREIKVLVADPAIVNKRSDTTGTTGKDELEAHLGGVKVVPGTNRRIDGWIRVRQHLQPKYNPNTKQNESMIEITSSCINLIRTLPELIYDKGDVEDCDTTGDDHAPDTLRYGVMYLSNEKPGFATVKDINDSMTRGNTAKHKPTDEFKETKFFKKSSPNRKQNLLTKKY